MYISQNAGDNWTSLGSNMPIIPVYDLVYNPVYNQIVAATFARGIMTFDLSQLGINSEVSQVQSYKSQGDWKIYPTISTDIIHFKVDPKATASKAKMFNSKGVLFDQFILNNNLQIDISDLPSGIYYIKRVGESAKRFMKISE